MKNSLRASTPQESATHKKYVNVIFLNKEESQFQVDAKAKVQELFNQVCDYVGLRETEYFGLANLVDDEYQFLTLDDKLNKHAPKAWKQSNSGCDKTGKYLLTLHFKVQYYVDEVSLLRERVTRHQYYLQLRQNLLQYGQPSSDDRYFLLASFALQADLGKYNSSRHTQSYFDPREYFPAWIVDEHSEDYAIKHMPAMHEDLRHMSKAEAQLQYIREASTPPCPYNLHLYRLKKKKSENHGTIWLGICAKGIELYEESSCSSLIGALSTFLWADIGKLYFDKKKFEIRSVGSPEGRKFTYYTGSDDRSKYLLALCRNTHMIQMAMQPKLAEIQNFEIEDRKRYHESYIYTDSSDLAWEQEQSLIRGSLTLHGYSTLQKKCPGDNRTSVISNTSSNTTSGIVSDKMCVSFDDSEDDRDGDGDGDVPVDEGRASRESTNSGEQNHCDRNSSPTNSSKRNHLCSFAYTHHSPTTSESGRSITRADAPLMGPPLPPRLYDPKMIQPSGSNGNSPSASISSQGLNASANGNVQGFKRTGSGSSHSSRASTHSAKNTVLQTVNETQALGASSKIEAEKEHDYEHIYENIIPRTDAHTIPSVPTVQYGGYPPQFYYPGNPTPDSRVYVLPTSVPLLQPADHKLVISKPKMGITGIATARSGPVGSGNGITSTYRYSNGLQYGSTSSMNSVVTQGQTQAVNGSNFASGYNGYLNNRTSSSGHNTQLVSNPNAISGQMQVTRPTISNCTNTGYNHLVSPRGVINEIMPRPQTVHNVYVPHAATIERNPTTWAPQIQISPSHSPTESGSDNQSECAIHNSAHRNIDEIRDLTQNMRLPLINALCNDRSLMPSGKSCTCQGSQTSLNHLHVHSRPDPKRLSASYTVNSPMAMQLSARPMSWHSETFDLDRQLQLHWNQHHASGSNAMLNSQQNQSSGINMPMHTQTNNGYIHQNGGYRLVPRTNYNHMLPTRTEGHPASYNYTVNTQSINGHTDAQDVQTKQYKESLRIT